MSRKINILAIATAICIQSVSAEVWTYDQCVEYAKAHNIDLQKMRLSEATAKHDIEQAEAQWHPTLDFATSHNYNNYPWGKQDKNSYNGSVGLNAGWTVWNGGERENTIKRARIQSEIETLNTSDMLRSIESDLMQVYINILYARESTKIYSEAAKLSLAQAERAKALMEAGKLSRVDYAQLQAQYEQDNYAKVNAEATYRTRVMELKELLELGIDSDISPADVEWTKAQIIADLPPMQESYEMALATDLQLLGLDKQKESAALDVAIAKSGKMPKISLNAGVNAGYQAPGIAFNQGMKQSVNEGIGLTLSIPLLDNKKTKTAIAKAKIQELNAALDIDRRKTDLAQLVEKWYIETQSAQSRYAAAEQQFEAASTSYDLTSEKFNIGYLNTVELMTAHNSLIEAKYSLLQAKYMAMLGRKMIDYYRTAEITLP